jgi:hypothetical protein
MDSQAPTNSDGHQGRWENSISSIGPEVLIYFLMDGWMDHGSWMSACRCSDVWNLDCLCYMLVPLSLNWGWGPIEDPKPEWGWVCDEFCIHDGYGDGSNMMGMSMGCYNPVENSPLTSLVAKHPAVSKRMLCTTTSITRIKVYGLFWSW